MRLIPILARNVGQTVIEHYLILNIYCHEKFFQQREALSVKGGYRTQTS